MSITFIIIIANILISFYGFKNNGFFLKNKFNISSLKSGEYYRLITSGFLHVDFNHLLLNMLTLFFFINPVINTLGFLYFFIIYFFCLLGGNLFAYYYHIKENNYSAVGASGAVMGIIFSSILLNPSMKLFFIFIPIPIPGYLFGIGYLLYTILGMKNKNDSIGHSAHFGGAVAGLLFTVILVPSIIYESTMTLLLLILTIILSLYLIKRIN
tara:strand:- start:218 stop:853 length:636 start_codon:yes stop_codon:yes gene_type:complete